MSAESPKSILDRRLALGEITVDEYEQLIRVIATAGGHNNEQARASKVTQRWDAPDVSSHETPLATVDDLLVFQHSIRVSGESIPLASITRVHGGADQFSYNFIPMTKFSTLHICTSDAREFDYTEARTYLGGSRHKQIRAAYGVLRHLTWQHRLDNLVSRLKQSGRLTLGFHRDDTTKPVTLHLSGCLDADGLVVDLKTARSVGAFGIGTLAKSISGLSSEQKPDEIVASLHPVGWRTFHRDSIVFTPVHEDTDVVALLLDWLAEPGNSLG